MRIISLVFGWIFGLFFCVVGIALLFSIPMAGLTSCIIGLSLLPRIKETLYKKTNIKVHFGIKLVVFIILIITFVKFIDNGERSNQALNLKKMETEQLEKLAELKKENEKHFYSNRFKIIKNAKESLKNKDYQSVIIQSNKYTFINDAELNRIIDSAANVIQREKNKNETIKILSELKSVSSADYEKNRSLYKRLVDLNPSNKKYRQKLSYYAKNARLEKEKFEKEKQINQKRKEQIEKSFNPFNGSHFELTRHIKRNMNDPKSYKHVETTYIPYEDYLMVRTTFRGKNAYGVLVFSVIKAKVAYDGSILKIVSQS